MKRRAVPMPATVALFVAVAALLLHVFAWGLLAPAMALGPIDGLCIVAENDVPNSDHSKAPADHCPLSLLAQGLTAPPVPPAVVPPAAAVVAANVATPVAVDYVGWFLSTRQARGPPAPGRAG